MDSRKETLKTISGIGDSSAGQLLILLPELGTLTRKQIASLTGLTPRSNESGTYRGKWAHLSIQNFRYFEM